MPAVGQQIILFANGVVQEETHYLYEHDPSDWHKHYYWANNHCDCTEDTYEIKNDHKWMPLPEPPNQN